MSDYEREVTFEIVEHIGVLATSSTGWRKEINLVRWNGAAEKYDIREWDPSHDRMSRGITLKENEMRVLLEVMRRRRSGPRRDQGSFASRDAGFRTQGGSNGSGSGRYESPAEPSGSGGSDRASGHEADRAYEAGEAAQEETTEGYASLDDGEIPAEFRETSGHEGDPAPF